MDMVPTESTQFEGTHLAEIAKIVGNVIVMCFRDTCHKHLRENAFWPRGSKLQNYSHGSDGNVFPMAGGDSFDKITVTTFDGAASDEVETHKRIMDMVVAQILKHNNIYASLDCWADAHECTCGS